MHAALLRHVAPRFFAVLLGVLALVAPLTDADAQAPGRTPPFVEGRLWRVTRAGLGDSFVFGVIHVADPRVSALPAPVVEALGRTRTLAMELPPVEVVDAQVFELEQLDDGHRLEPLIGPEAYARVRYELAMTGTPERVIARLKPWAALMKLTWGAPRGDASTLDENLLLAARMRRMQLVSLESIEEQIAAFDTIPLASQVALLRNALDHREELAAMTEPTIAAWQRGDLAALALMSQRISAPFPGMAPHYAELARHVIDDRTVVMHHRLFLPLRSGRVFVAVGALHLYGDRGLLAMLRRDGWGVTRVW
jgi:uncharacterized protein YbaP (TraB family)